MSRKNRQQATEQQGINTAFGASELLTKRIEAAQDAERRAQEAARALRETVAEADSLNKAIRAGETRLRRLADNEVAEILEAEVTRQLNAFGEITERSIKESEAAVFRRFDKLTNILMGEEHDGKPSISEMVDQMEALFQFKWEKLLVLVSSVNEVAKGCVDANCPLPAKYALLVRISPAATGGKSATGHLHLCETHTLEMKATGTVMKTVWLPTNMCPYPHEGRTILDFKDNDGRPIYNTDVYGELDLPEEVRIDLGDSRYATGKARKVQ